MDLTTLDGRAYAKFLAAGAYFLKTYRPVLNDLNVFPVPDGDTGTNMFLTARSAALAAARVRSGSLADVSTAAAEGALMGARGNSGVILSQMLRGFAHHVRHRPQIDTFVLATAMREAVDAARQALVRPVEGTIISVGEAAHDAAYRLALHEPEFYRLCNGVVRAANEALERTPEQLPVLKEAGVVDAGGAGLVYFLEGALRFLPEEQARATAFPRRPIRQRVFTAAQVVGENRFCTEFILEQATCTVLELREALQARGDSLIVAGEPPRIKVHLHTDDPKGVAALVAKHGVPERWKVDDMEQQHNVLVVDRPAVPHSIVAVVPGRGFEAIARELGAEVVLVAAENPSVRDLLLAVNKCLSDDVYLFVNDANVKLAANEVTKLTDRRVRVLPTADVVGGIAGLFTFRSSAAADAPSESAIMAAAGAVRSIAVFFAGKDASIGGTTVTRGKPVASSGGALYTGGSLADAARAALDAHDAQHGGLITVYYGSAQRERDAARLAEELRGAYPRAEVEYYFGGQPNVEFWVSYE